MERNIQNIRDNVSKAIDDNKPEATPQQWLLYAGAAGAAAGAAAIALNPEGVEKMYGNDTPTMTGSVGRKYRHLTALQMAGHSALQALAAHEKPSSRMLAVNGGLWTAGSVLTGAHTFHTKSLKKETGLALGGVQLAIGAAMIGRAIYMERNDI